MPPSEADRSLGEGERLLLDRLVGVLTGILRGGSETPPGDEGPDPDRWADRDYIYFEADIAGVPNRDVDISLHEGRVLVRLEK